MKETGCKAFSKEHNIMRRALYLLRNPALAYCRGQGLKKIDELNERLKLAEDYDRQSIITQLQEATMQLTEIKSK